MLHEQGGEGSSAFPLAGRWVEADDGWVAVEEGLVVLGGVGEEVGELIRDLDPVHGAGQHVLRAGPARKAALVPLHVEELLARCLLDDAVQPVREEALPLRQV